LDRAATPQRVLWIVLAINLAVSLTELVFGVVCGSLALISDGFHNLGDSGSLVISLIAAYLATKKADFKRTFGYTRAEVIAGSINGFVLLVVAIFIIVHAIKRFFEPVEVVGEVMIIFGALGFVVNAASTILLKKPSKDDLNVRGAYLHMFFDALHSLAVVAGGILVSVGVGYVDETLSILISAFIVKSSVSLLRETLNILLEGMPKDLSMEKVKGCIKGVNGVEDVHDIHVWSISSKRHAISAHVVVKDQSVKDAEALLCDIRERLKRECGINHATLQVEPTDSACDTCSFNQREEA